MSPRNLLAKYILQTKSQEREISLFKKDREISVGPWRLVAAFRRGGADEAAGSAIDRDVAAS